MFFLMSLLILGLLMPLKVNAITAIPMPKKDVDLVQFSFRVNKTETYGKLKYRIDFFADTGDESMPIEEIDSFVSFSSALDLVDRNINKSCKVIGDTLRVSRNSDNTKTMSFNLDCMKQGGKLNVMSFELKPNIPDKIDHLLLFNPEYAFVWSGNEEAFSGPDYHGEWVSGSSNYMILSDFAFGSGCSDAKKMGDYNNDGSVNGLDYSYWKQEFVDKIQHDGRWEASHVCGDAVTPEDYSVWRYNYLE